MHETERIAVDALFGMLSNAITCLSTPNSAEGEEEADHVRDLKSLQQLLDVTFTDEVLQTAFLSNISCDGNECQRDFKGLRRVKRRQSVLSESDPGIIFTHAITNLLCLALGLSAQFKDSPVFQRYVNKLTTCTAGVVSGSGQRMSKRLGTTITVQVVYVHIYFWIVAALMCVDLRACVCVYVYVCVCTTRECMCVHCESLCVCDQVM